MWLFIWAIQIDTGKGDQFFGGKRKMDCFGFIDGGLAREERLEEEHRASEEARAKAAEAAEKRQEEFAKSAAGKAARAQMQAAAKQASNPNRGEPTLKWQMG